MKQRELVSSIILLAIAMTILLETRKLPIGSLREPNVGFFPLILGILLAILSLLLVWNAIEAKGEGGGSMGWLKSGSLKRIGLAAAALFAFAFLFEFLGYMICTFLLISFLLFTIGSQKWWIAISVGLISSLFSFLLFDLLLDVRLPAGLFEF